MEKRKHQIKDSKIVNIFCYRVLKRIIDIILGIILLLFFIPIYLIIGILIKTTSVGPVFYNWNVIGKNGVSFKSWKFRTMVTDADKNKIQLSSKNEMIGPVFKIKNDPRLTSIGKIMRKYSIDELPQLFNILLGTNIHYMFVYAV